MVQLQKTMEEMLERAGVNDSDIEIKGPTQVSLTAPEKIQKHYLNQQCVRYFFTKSYV